MLSLWVHAKECRSISVSREGVISQDTEPTLHWRPCHPGSMAWDVSPHFLLGVSDPGGGQATHFPTPTPSHPGGPCGKPSPRTQTFPLLTFQLPIITRKLLCFIAMASGTSFNYFALLEPARGPVWGFLPTLPASQVAECLVLLQQVRPTRLQQNNLGQSSLPAEIMGHQQIFKNQNIFSSSPIWVKQS